MIKPKPKESTQRKLVPGNMANKAKMLWSEKSTVYIIHYNIYFY